MVDEGLILIGMTWKCGRLFSIVIIELVMLKEYDRYVGKSSYKYSDRTEEISEGAQVHRLVLIDVRKSPILGNTEQRRESGVNDGYVKYYT